MSDQQPVRVIVELVSSADVRQLTERDNQLLAEIQQLRKENEGLRRSFYDLLERVSEWQRSTQKK